ncbi:MAG: GIY-YIG nuclease family protein [Firmicutes bacterium]|nr:GIY-YIG nuclease family protein [Bacillota bacterium]
MKIEEKKNQETLIHIEDRISIGYTECFSINLTSKDIEKLNKIERLKILDEIQKSAILKNNYLEFTTNEFLQYIIRKIQQQIEHIVSCIDSSIYTFKIGRTYNYKKRINEHNNKQLVHSMYVLSESNSIDFIQFLESYYAELCRHYYPEHCENIDVDSNGDINKDVPFQYLYLIVFKR